MLTLLSQSQRYSGNCYCKPSCPCPQLRSTWYLGGMLQHLFRRNLTATCESNLPPVPIAGHPPGYSALNVIDKVGWPPIYDPYYYQPAALVVGSAPARPLVRALSCCAWVTFSLTPLLGFRRAEKDVRDQQNPGLRHLTHEQPKGSPSIDSSKTLAMLFSQ